MVLVTDPCDNAVEARAERARRVFVRCIATIVVDVLLYD